ncbi:TPA: hypothetical protein ACH3X1_001260 [Trebouxia sp. C0004]
MVLGTSAQNQEGLWNTESGIQVDHDPDAQVHVQWTRDAYASKIGQLQSSAGAAPLMMTITKITSGKVADLRTHAANCKKATPEAKLAARVQQVKAGGGGGKTSSQMSLESYAMLTQAETNWGLLLREDQCLMGCTAKSHYSMLHGWQMPILPNLARHLTLTLDGWSNARIESIYSFNIIFPDRRMILLKSEDLSTITHSGENIAGVLFAGLVNS